MSLQRISVGHAVSGPLSLSHSAGSLAVIRNAFGLLLQGIANARKEIHLRRAVRQLSALDDRLLRDIGIGRAEIEGVVRCGRLRGDQS